MPKHAGMKPSGWQVDGRDLVHVWSTSHRMRAVPNGLQRHVVRAGHRCNPGETSLGQNPDKDEAAGPSPARPTTPRLSCGNAVGCLHRSRSLPSVCAQRSRTHPCTAVLGRCGSSVEREAVRQVLWRVQQRAVLWRAEVSMLAGRALTKSLPQWAGGCGIARGAASGNGWTGRGGAG
jgi:hypothetical protein